MLITSSGYLNRMALLVVISSRKPSLIDLETEMSIGRKGSFGRIRRDRTSEKAPSDRMMRCSGLTGNEPLEIRRNDVSFNY